MEAQHGRRGHRRFSTCKGLHDPGDTGRPIVVVSVQDNDRPVKYRPSADHCVARPPRLGPRGAESVLVHHHQVEILTVLRHQVALNVLI